MAVKKEVAKKETKKTVSKTKVKTEKITPVETNEKVVETVEETKTIERKAKTKKELRNELKKLKNDIEVEILNLSTGRVCYIGKDGDFIFDLNKYGEKESVELEDIYKVASKNKGFFEKHYITIVDVDNDDYTVDDILEYIGVKSVYSKIENYDTDYIEEILLEMDDYDFEKAISVNDIYLVERLADRAKSLYKEGRFDSMNRAKIIADRLKIDDLFELI